MPKEGSFSRGKNYLGTVRDLKDKGGQYVFKKAYHIEKYFELGLIDEEKVEKES